MDRQYWEYLSEITGYLQEFGTILSLENKPESYSIVLSCYCDEMEEGLNEICGRGGLKYDYFPHSHQAKKGRHIKERPSVKFLFTEA